jgi:hypothetical protein
LAVSAYRLPVEGKEAPQLKAPEQLMQGAMQVVPVLQVEEAEAAQEVPQEPEKTAARVRLPEDQEGAARMVDRQQ